MKKGYAAGGGTGRMRDIGGVKAPAEGSNDKLMKQAKGATTGKVGMAGIGADGVPVKSRLDRPGRKSGGKAAMKGC